MAKVTLCSCVVLSLLLQSGCGGGGTGGTVPLPVNKGIILSANLKQGLEKTSLPIKGIEVTFVLPKTATPILDTNGSLQIGETGLKGLNPNGSILAGNYDPGTGEVHFILLPNNIATSDLGTGDIARLTYETASGAELSPDEIRQTLSYKVSGPGTVPISSEIEPSVRIVTYLKP